MYSYLCVYIYICMYMCLESLLQVSPASDFQGTAQVKQPSFLRPGAFETFKQKYRTQQILFVLVTHNGATLIYVISL